MVDEKEQERDKESAESVHIQAMIRYLSMMDRFTAPHWRLVTLAIVGSLDGCIQGG